MLPCPNPGGFGTPLEVMESPRTFSFLVFSRLVPNEFVRVCPQASFPYEDRSPITSWLSRKPEPKTSVGVCFRIWGKYSFPPSFLSPHHSPQTPSPCNRTFWTKTPIVFSFPSCHVLVASFLSFSPPLVFFFLPAPNRSSFRQRL